MTANDMKPDWIAAEGDAQKALAIAERLALGQSAAPPAALLPSLVLAVAVSHAAARIAESVYAVEVEFQPVDVSGIESQLSDIAGAIQNHD